MEKMRLDDLRHNYQKAEDSRTPFGMLYYLRDFEPGLRPARRINNIVAVDRDQKMLSYDREIPRSIVNFGEAEGMLPLQHSIKAQDVNRAKMDAMNQQSM